MQVRSTLSRMTPYVAGERRTDAIKLSSNENPLGPSPAALEAVRRALDESHIYPDGALRGLRTAIAGHMGTEPEMIIPGNGSDEVLTMIAGTYLNPGERVLIGEHTFSQYAFAARLLDAEIERVPMPELRLTPEAILRAVAARRDPPRAIFICTPNNPTGIAFTRAELRHVLDNVSERTLVVVDHAYQEYATSPEVADATAMVNRYPNLIVLRTFSKIYGLAANRIGYGVATAERIAELERVRLPFNVNGLGQAAAIGALGDDGFVVRSLETNRRGDERMRALLAELGYQPLPSEANFLCFPVGGDARAAAEIIASHGATVRALGSFGLPGHLRVTIGTDQQIDVLERGLRALAAQIPPDARSDHGARTGAANSGVTAGSQQ
ncbi:MAG: histidinol-phosphate transaminase [Spirochaeta sp.]|jgi:histidinol-phosphate aminotransferase|nr:histidinol-phosphate transaminase [Spirochaeta sp.]